MLFFCFRAGLSAHTPHSAALHLRGIRCNPSRNPSEQRQLFLLVKNTNKGIDEKVQISSVQKYWSYLLETLKRIHNRK